MLHFFIFVGDFFMTYTFKPKRVCSVAIKFDLENGIISNVSFNGGCDGNLKAISKLVNGMEASKVIEILKGNDCRGRGTSCADQLAQGIELALYEQNEEK